MCERNVQCNVLANTPNCIYMYVDSQTGHALSAFGDTHTQGMKFHKAKHV